MESVEVTAEEVVTNYYTGERWFLVNINGSETYVNEARYLELQGKTQRLEPNLTKKEKDTKLKET